MNVERRQEAAELRPGQTTWSASPPIGCQSLHPSESTPTITIYYLSGLLDRKPASNGGSWIYVQAREASEPERGLKNDYFICTVSYTNDDEINISNTNMVLEVLVLALTVMQEKASTFGLQINWSKTKILQVPSSSSSSTVQVADGHWTC